MRLLYTTNDFASFQAHRLPLVQAAGDSGYEVHVASPSLPDGFDGSNGVRYHEIPLSRRGMQPLKEATSVRALVRLYKKLRPDVVHHMTIKPVLYGGTAARLSKTPAVVNTVTGLGYAFLANGFRGRLLRSGVSLGYRVALGHPNQRVVFQNPDDQQQFVAARMVREEDTLLIRGSGVDLQRFKPLPPSTEEPPCVVLPARMLWDKGVAEFVAAAKSLKEQGISARFALVGDTDPGNPASIPQKQLQAWADEGVVQWWGWRADMDRVYEQAHAVCLPSYREGVPRVLLEAQACARPVVTTDVPGCREAVVPGETGLRVPAKDVQALAEAIRTLVEDAALRERMGRAGRKRAEAEFDQTVVNGRTLQVYEALL